MSGCNFSTRNTGQLAHVCFGTEKKELRELNRREIAKTLINSMPNTMTLEESKKE